MEKPQPTFTIDDLLAELGPEEIPDGVTVRELCQRSGDRPTNQNMNRTEKRVHDLIAEGIWEYAGKRPAISITGARIKVPAYRPKGGGD